jgi:hypothetical protein
MESVKSFEIVSEIPPLKPLSLLHKQLSPPELRYKPGARSTPTIQVPAPKKTRGPISVGGGDGVAVGISVEVGDGGAVGLGVEVGGGVAIGVGTGSNVGARVGSATGVGPGLEAGTGVGTSVDARAVFCNVGIGVLVELRPACSAGLWMSLAHAARANKITVGINQTIFKIFPYDILGACGD